MRNKYQLTSLLLAIFVLSVMPFSAADGGQSALLQINGLDAKMTHYLNFDVAKEQQFDAKVSHVTNTAVASDFVASGEASALIYAPMRRKVRLFPELPLTALRMFRIPEHPFLSSPRRIK